MGTNKYVGTKTEKNLWEAFAELPEGLIISNYAGLFNTLPQLH